MMSKELGKRITQGQVSRWVGKVCEFIEAGNVMPELSTLADTNVSLSKPITVDPTAIDMGKHLEYRAKRQRRHRQERESDPDS